VVLAIDFRLFDALCVGMACHDNRKFSVNTFEYLPEPATLLLLGLGAVELKRLQSEALGL